MSRCVRMSRASPQSSPPASAAADLALYSTQLLTRSPASNPAAIEALVRERYGIESRAERLTGERDENFRVHTAEGPGYVLKVSPAGEPDALTDLPVAVL